MTTMTEIEAACKVARAARDLLKERAETLQDEITLIQKRRLPGIRTAVANVAEADAKVMALLQDAPHLFVKPRSVVLFGLKVGYAKGKGKIEIADEVKTIALIRKHYAEQFDALVKTTEKPIKKALQNMSAADLRRLGIMVEDTGDVVFVTDATDGVDKLVAALLKGAEAEQAAEPAEEAS